MTGSRVPVTVAVGTPRVADGVATIPLCVGDARRSVWIRSAVLDPPSVADAGFLLAYGLAMALHAPCVASAPVSETLLQRAPTFGDIQRSWYPWLGTPELRVATRPDGIRNGSGQCGVFFSGGLDSFHTAITHRDSLDALVFVLGADVPLRERALADHVRARLELAADELGLPLVSLATNLRALSDDYAPWGYFVGPAMSALAMTLGPRFGTILYSASYGTAMTAGRRTDRDAIDNGLVRVVRVGDAAHRTEKARAVGAHPAVRAHLRVCWENRGSDYNCGRCPKCTRTMREMAAAGALDGCATLPAQAVLVARSARSAVPAVEANFLAQLEGSSGDPPRRSSWPRRVAGATRRRIRPRPSRFAGDLVPDEAPAAIDPMRHHAVDLASRVALALRPALAPHRAVALVGLSPRNAGDALAWWGALALLRRWRIRVAHVSMFPVLDADGLRRRHPTGPILLAGGGNLGTLYPQLHGFRTALLASFPDRPVIQLPQSVQVDEQQAAETADPLRAHADFTLFVRDDVSRRRAERLGLAPHLCPDMALAVAGPEVAVPDIGRDRILWLGRADGERSAVRPPADAPIDYVDLGDRRDVGRSVERLAWQTGTRFAAGPAARTRSWSSQRLAAWALRRVAAAPAVVTERLHGHILCLLTGTPHVIVPDAFGKIEAFARTWGTVGPGVEIVHDGEAAVAHATRLAVTKGYER
jgi:pyruvyl transferase EpsO